MGNVDWEDVDLRIEKLKDEGAAATGAQVESWDATDDRVADLEGDQYNEPAVDVGKFGTPGNFAHHFQGGMLRTSAGHVGAIADALPDSWVEPGLGEREVERGIRQGKIPANPPTTTLGRAGETGGRLAMGGLEASAAMTALVANFPALATSGGAGFLATLGRMILGPLKTAPVEAAAVNLGASMGGGASGGAAGEAARAVGLEDYAQHAELVGSFPGAMGGGMGAARLPGALERGVTGTVAKAGRRVPLVRDIPAVKRAGDAFRESEALDEATRLLRQGQNSPTENVQRIQQAQQIQEQLPGTEFNTGQATGDLAYQTKVGDLTRHGQAYSGRIKGMQERTQAALKGHLEDSAPNQSSGAELLRKHVQRGVDKHLSDLDANLAQVEQGVQTRLQQVGQSADYGDEVARGVNDELVPWFRGKADELYAPLEAMGERFRLPMARIKHFVQTEYADLPPAQVKDLGKLPNSVQSIIDAPDIETFGNVRGIGVSINRNIRQLERSGENDTAVFLLRRVKSVLKDSLDEMRDSGEFLTDGVDAGQVKAMWSEADEFYRQGASKLRQGITGRISGQGKGAQVPASDAAKAVANPNGAGYRERALEWGGLRSYMRSQGLDAEVEQFESAMRGHLTRDAYDSVGFGVAGKKVKADSLTRWREQNKDMLRQHPEVDRQLADVETAQRFFEAEGVNHATAVKTHEQSTAAAFLKKDVGEAIDVVLKHPDPRKAAGQLLLKAGNNDDALAGMKRAVWDRMMDDAFKDALDDGTWRIGGPPVQVVDPKAMARIAGDKKYQPLLEVLWGKEHLANTRTIMRAAKLAGKSHASGVTRESPEQVKQANVVSRHYFNRWARGDIKRMADGSSVLFRAGASFVDNFFEKFPADIVTRIMEEAMANPAYAKMLLTRVTPQNTKTLTQSIASKIGPAMVGVGAQSAAPATKRVYGNFSGDIPDSYSPPTPPERRN